MMDKNRIGENGENIVQEKKNGRIGENGKNIIQEKKNDRVGEKGENMLQERKTREKPEGIKTREIEYIGAFVQTRSSREAYVLVQTHFSYLCVLLVYMFLTLFK